MMNEDAAQAKKVLRRDVRARYGGSEVRALESRQICCHILSSEMYQSARVVGGYMPMLREADITPVLEDVLRSGRILALPLCGEAPYMTFRRVERLSDLVPGAWGIPEPSASAEIVLPQDMQLLLTPLEAIAPSGMRLGKGGGYYDCFLQDAAVPTLGCALSWQWVEHVPAQPWDRPLAACADPDGVRRFASYSN